MPILFHVAGTVGSGMVRRWMSGAMGISHSQALIAARLSVFDSWSYVLSPYQPPVVKEEYGDLLYPNIGPTVGSGSLRCG